MRKALQWLVVVLLESGEHAQACAFPSPCHHLAPDDRWGNSLARYPDWPKTTGSLHQKLPSFMPLGVLDPQEHQAGTGLKAETKNRPAPGRPAYECSALSPLHPILISALHLHTLPVLGHNTHSGHCHHLRRLHPPPSSLSPGLLQGGVGGDVEASGSFIPSSSSAARPGWEYSSREAVTTTGRPAPSQMPRGSVGLQGRRKGTCPQCICCH